MEEWSLLFQLDALQILFPLGLEELEHLKFHLLGLLLLEMLEARPATVEVGIVDFSSEHEVIGKISCFHLLFLFLLK